MGKRTIIGKFYVERDKHGHFKKWTSISKSISADMRRKSKTHPKKPGHGHEGDYKR
jgi:hypothetical protein